MGVSALVIAVARAFIISLVLTPIARDIFRAYNVVDRPSRRKVHAYPIPRVGGIPIAAAFFVTLLTLPAGQFPQASLTWKLLPAALFIFLIGLVDDFINLK